MANIKKYNKHNLPFPLTMICIAMSSILFPVAHAEVVLDDGGDGTLPVVVLQEEVVVNKKSKEGRKAQDVTGLGKVFKTKSELDRQQVMSIRDLTRYDPGISVVEQGRGASSGYSIRGVDKNRVSLQVDGINQVQSYVVQGQREGSGAINEIEYENLGAITISKGASSSESGSGALGGSVGFRSKEVSDILDDDQSYGLQHKSAYSSKNKQWLHSLGVAGRAEGFEALIQYTDRKGEETKPHKDAFSHTVYQVERLGGYPQDFTGSPPEAHLGGHFIIENECPTRDCPAKQGSHRLHQHTVTERIDAKTYTGSQRILPDPMNYESGSWFARAGYAFTPEHYVGAVLEQTEQRYDIRDMTMPAYYLTRAQGELEGMDFSSGIYRGDHYIEGIVIKNNSQDKNPIGMEWSRTRYIDEKHQKNRHGLFYRYQNDQQDSLIDSATLSYDKQDIKIDNLLIDKRCSPYPTVDRNCTPTVDKANSYESSERNIYQEKHDLFRLTLEKAFNHHSIKHDVQFLAGFDKFSSNLWRGDLYSKYANLNFENIDRLADYGTPPKVTYVYRELEPTLTHIDLCSQTSTERACGDRLITGHNYFASLRDRLSLGKRWDLSLGLRHDTHKFKSDDSWTASANYQNTSWNTGLVFKPNDNVALSYRISSGYRVPSFQELFGYRVPGFMKGRHDDAHYVTKVKPERALNQEWGVALKNDFGALEASYFDNKYNDLISLSLANDQWGYRNTQDVRLTGINLLAKIDDQVWHRLPEGAYATLGFNRTKAKSSEIKPDLTWVQSYLLDTIQPSRYVLGVGYDAPSDKWGTNLMFTYSEAKKADELQGLTHSVGKGAQSDYAIQATNITPKSWRTVDLSGYYRPTDKITMRAGVYNLFDYRYLPWESVRQSSLTAINRHKDNGAYQRYAAPGRNFMVSAEVKF